ncbi:hypothetical protein CICLE_v10023836mg, partial [Citrus x clementina]
FGQSACRGGGRKGGKPFRRGGRLVGRGRGHGAISNSTPSAAVPGQTSSSIPGQVPGAPTRPPPPMAWCELCRVDCNTLEILEQHKNGKRHKRNLRTHADLQNLNKCIAGQQNIQMPNSGSQPEVSQPEKVEECREKQPLESLPSQTLLGNASNETEMQKNTVDSVKEPQRKSRDQPDSRGCGSKRKMRGGRGGKYMRTNEGGPRRPIEPPKPKGVIPLICELCNVKCESQVVFDSHLVGKKHLANVKRFHGHRALYGEAALQSLYPASFNSLSSSVITQVQQGVNDPQVVLAQLLTYVLSQAQAQAQAPGLLAEQLRGLAAQIPGLVGMVAPAPAPGSSQETQYQHDFRTQRSMATTEEGSKNTVMVEAEDQQQSIATDLESPETVGIETKEKNASLPQDKKIISSLENPINTASASKCEVASGEEFLPNATRRKKDSLWRGGFSLGVDLGLSRTGLALSKGFCVRPLTVLKLRGEKLELQLLEIAQREETDEFIIGLPKSWDGSETPQSNKVRSVAGRLAVRAAERGWRVYLLDEHRTSAEAVDRMINMGLSKSARQTKTDAYAAVILLERYFSMSGQGTEIVLPKRVDLQEKLRKGALDNDFFPDKPEG